ncbi:ABC transporter substrate-binding protein [Ramlibacter sp. 2FC]|uniref:ABC transporter substrate-binding protein n=1 Tax=Ramlibacter sp. 2FC TaxID=2502188 RepID=UPI0010F6C28F|nr:ABC transporter substrate-binding protein [Ramlibacter sp. 2FC]
MSKLKPLAALALSAILPFAALAQKKEPVQVGLVTSKSGQFAQQGEEVLRAIQFAIDEANAKGGVDGREVKVQVADDEGTPDAGRRVAEKLARDGHNLLIGAIPSSISMAIAQNLERWDAVYFGTLSKSDKMTGDSCKARSFRTNHSDAMDLAMIGEWMKSFKEQNYAVIASDYVWGRDSGESFVKKAAALGKKADLSLYVPMGTKDFSPYIAQLKASDAQAVWVAIVGRDGIAFVKQAQEFGLIGPKRLLGHALIFQYVADATGKATEGTWGNIGYGAEIDNPRNKAFVQAFKAKFNRLPTENEGAAYNGIQVMFEGVKKAGSVKPAEVAKALRGAQLDTVYGQVTMRAQDNQLLIPNYVGVVKAEGGKLRPVIQQSFPATLAPQPSPDCKL